MATSQMKPLPTATREPSRVAAPAVIYSGEALLLVVTLGIGLLAWVGLALADTGRYSLPAALALAVSATAAVVVVAWRATGCPRLVADRGGLATLAGVTLIAALLFFPGFAYDIGKDPGAYVSHAIAIAIARTGSSTLEDPVLDRSRFPPVEVTREDPVGRFPGDLDQGVVFAAQSVPLRHHQEHGGSFEAVQRIANAAGDREGVFLWQQTSESYGVAYSFGGAVWLQQGQVHLPHAGVGGDLPDPAVQGQGRCDAISIWRVEGT